MKIVRFAFALVLVLLLAFSSVAFADDPTPDVPGLVSDFMIDPSTIYPGYNVDFVITLTGMTDSSTDTICLYYPDSIWSMTIISTATMFSAWAPDVTYSKAASYALGGATASCPGAPGKYAAEFSTTDNLPAGETADQVFINLNVPADAHTTTFQARHHQGASWNGLNVLKTLTVLHSITIHADAGGVCGGNLPCYDDLGWALNNAAPGGKVLVYSDFSGGFEFNRSCTVEPAAGYHPVISASSVNPLFRVNDGDSVVKDFDLVGLAAGTLIEGYAGKLTLKGNTIDNVAGSLVAFSGGDIVMYANNVSNVGTVDPAGSPGGDDSFAHNWWGSAWTKPAGVPAGVWANRLPAPVVSYADGINSATLGGASMTGSGTALIVNHGRSNTPFGNGIAPFQNTMCGDYHDFIVVDGSGLTWDIVVPVDNGAACNAEVLATGMIYTIENNLQCQISTDSGCWDHVAPSKVVVDGQAIRVSGLNLADLAGEKFEFVVGSTQGTDPTVISLNSLTATAASNTWLPFALLGVAVLLAGGGFTIARRRR